MKKLFFVLMGVLMFTVPPAFSEELQIGMGASDWSFEDAQHTVFTMESWAGKVLLVNYVDPDEADINEHFTEAVKKALDEGRLSNETYKGIGIADCAATWKPNFLIRKIAGKKAEKYNTTILFDYNAQLRTAWGLAKDTGNAVLLDKGRVCRAIVRGRVPDGQVEPLIKLMVELQSK